MVLRFGRLTPLFVGLGLTVLGMSHFTTLASAQDAPASPSDELKNLVPPEGAAPGVPAPPAPDAPAPAAEPAGPAPQPKVLDMLAKDRSYDAVIATTNMGDIKVRDLVEYYSQYLYPANAVPVKPVVRPEMVAKMPGPWIDSVAKSLAISMGAEKAFEEIKQKDPAEAAEYEKNFHSWLLNYSLPEVRKFFIEDKLTSPTEEAIQKYYEGHKVEYRVPSQFAMRHLFLRTYEEYTVKESDTLESIAETALGDPAKVTEILADVPGRPKRWVAPADREKRLFKPLAPGEKLLLPMSAERAEQVRQAMESIIEEVKKGADFAALCKEYSQAETKGELIGPLPSGIKKGRELDPEVRKAGLTIPIGSLSPVIRTRHGYVVIQVTQRDEEHYRPFTEVRPAIVKEYRDRQTKELESVLIETMFAMPELKIFYEKFAKAPNLPNDETMIEVAGQKFTWNEIQSIWRQEIGENADNKLIFEGIRRHGGVFNALGLVWAQENKIFERPGMDVKYRTLRRGVLAAEHTKRFLAEYAKQNVSDQAIEQYYNEHKDKYGVPAQVSFQIVERRPPLVFANAAPEKKQQELDRIRVELDKEMAGIKTFPEFMAFSQKTNPPLPAGIEVGVHYYDSVVPINSEAMDGPTGDQVRKLEVKQWSKAYIDGERVRAVGLTDLRKGGTKPLGEVRKDIVTELRKKAQQEAAPNIERNWLTKLQYKFVLDDSKETAAK